jgi:hypothetical protein
MFFPCNLAKHQSFTYIYGNGMFLWLAMKSPLWSRFWPTLVAHVGIVHARNDHTSADLQVTVDPDDNKVRSAVSLNESNVIEQIGSSNEGIAVLNDVVDHALNESGSYE